MAMSQAVRARDFGVILPGDEGGAVGSLVIANTKVVGRQATFPLQIQALPLGQ